MSRKKLYDLLIVIGLLAAGFLVVPVFSIFSGQLIRAQAAPARQVPIFTPTPMPDGRIIYIVKANDTLLSISLLTGVPVETLRELNELTSDNILEGQQLLIGRAGPAELTVTPGPTLTPTNILPTPTPKPGTGMLCIMLFLDQNGDSVRQDEEVSIPGGQVSVSDRTGAEAYTEETTASLEYPCREIPEGEYTISVAVPDGYNPTTVTNYTLELEAGSTMYLDFGAQPNSETAAQQSSPAAEGTGRSPLLGIIGGLFLLAGISLAVFAGRIIKG